MAKQKTRKTRKSVTAYLDAIDDEGRRKDCLEISAMMEDLTGEKPEMWGESIVGFGSYRHRYASGREGEWPVTGFAPRKQNIAVYIMPGFKPFDRLMKKLGKHRTGKSCLYLNRLDDVDRDVLRELVDRSVRLMAERYPD